MMEKLTHELLDLKFELSLPKCELRQCGTASPHIYTGPGFIQQDSDGQLILRMFAAEQLSGQEWLNRAFPDDLSPGVIVPDTIYYDFSATDQAGGSWRAERQEINESFGVGTEVKAKLRRLEKVENLNRKTSPPRQAWFIPGDFKLPWHERTKTDKNISLDRFEFENDVFTWKVQKSDEGMWVSLTVIDGPLEPNAKHFLYALGILIGQILEPLVSNWTESGKLITQILPARPKILNSVLSPLELIPYQHQDAHRLLDCCMRHAEQPHPKPFDQLFFLYRFWHRIAKSHSSDIENSSLILSVAIEGVLKKLFHSEHDADQDFARHLSNATPIINKLDIPDRVLKSIERSLEHAAQPKPQDTLHRLNEQGALTDQHINAWKKLRHAGAHGALLEERPEKFQRHLDRYFCCLDLFYRLIFIAVGYRGQFVDRSKKGWPRSIFPDHVKK